MKISKAFSNDLKSLLEKSIDPIEFRDKYKGVRGEVGELFANIEHYLSDEDIREKDSVYRIMQNNELRKLVSMIEAGEPFEKLKGISFLSETT